MSPTKGPAGTIVTIYGSGFTSDRPNFINLADVVNHRCMTIEAIAADSSHLYFTAPNVPYRDYQISVDNETNGWCENYKTFTVTAK